MRHSFLAMGHVPEFLGAVYSALFHGNSRLVNPILNQISQNHELISDPACPIIAARTRAVDRNMLANVNLRKIQVDWIAPIHGSKAPYSQFLGSTVTMLSFVAKPE